MITAPFEVFGHRVGRTLAEDRQDSVPLVKTDGPLNWVSYFRRPALVLFQQCFTHEKNGS